MQAAVEKALGMNCLMSKRALAPGCGTTTGNENRVKRFEVGLRAYDRHKRTDQKLRQLLANYCRPAGGDSMSVATIPVATANARQYAKELKLATVGGQFWRCREAVKQKKDI